MSLGNSESLNYKGLEIEATQFSFAPSTSTTFTQGTNATTAVPITTRSGTITTVTQNIAAAGEVSFNVTFTNGWSAKAIPLVVVASGSVGGTTVASITAVSAGSFTITLTNLHAATAETGTLVLNFGVMDIV